MSLECANVRSWLWRGPALADVALGVGRPRGGRPIRGAPPAHVRDPLRRRARARPTRVRRSGSYRHSSGRTRTASASLRSSCSRSIAREGTPRRSTRTRGRGSVLTTTSASSRAQTCSSCRVGSCGRIPYWTSPRSTSVEGRSSPAHPEDETICQSCSRPPPRSSVRHSCSRQVEGLRFPIQWRRRPSGSPSSCRRNPRLSGRARSLDSHRQRTRSIDKARQRRDRPRPRDSGHIRRSSRAANRAPTAMATRIHNGGVGLVVALGHGPDAQALARLVRSSPDTRFVFIDTSLSELSLDGVPNAAAIRFAEEDVLFLAGYLSGLMPTMGGDIGGRIDRASVVAAAADRDTKRIIAGFKRGLHETNPAVVVRVDYSHELEDLTACERLANRQIDEGIGRRGRPFRPLRSRRSRSGENPRRVGHRRRGGRHPAPPARPHLPRIRSGLRPRCSPSRGSSETPCRWGGTRCWASRTTTPPGSISAITFPRRSRLR